MMRHVVNLWRPRLGYYMFALSPSLLPPAAPRRRVRVRGSCRACASDGRNDALIVGPGVLGSLAGSQWLALHPGCRVTAQTSGNSSHERLRALGFEPRTRAEAAGSSERFAHVLFCAPPSGSSDYAAEVRAACALWDGRGALVFTSSSAVYADSDDAQRADERTPTLPLGAQPRTDNLLRAEAACLDASGCVLRLAGLYTLRRGAHTYYLSLPEVPARPDGLLNLLHYADAAAAAVAALKAGAASRGAVFLACDGEPVTRQHMMHTAIASGLFPGGQAPRFTGSSGPLGKRLNCDATRAALGWAPRKKSFAAFLAGGGVDGE